MMSVVLASGSLDHKIRLWDATSGYCVKTIVFGESQVNCLQVSPDKKTIAVGGNPVIHIYSVSGNDDQPIITYEGHTSNVTSLGFQKDQKWLYSSSEDGTIKVWDKRYDTATRSYDCGTMVNAVALHPNQAVLISGDQNGCVKVWDLESAKVSDACKEQQIPAPDTPIRSISIASDASLLTVGSHKGKIFVYYLNEPKGGLQLVHEFQAHDAYLLKCVISPDALCLATTSADRTVRIWNTSTWKLERALTQHQKWVWDAVFSADSVYLVTVSSDQSGKLWDLRSGDVIRNYTGHSLAATCVALNDSSL